ncbi:Rieske 2Fe-2S domain-containing protein [Variovorax sp. DAIF25]|uniref:Rieske 2Fe-2S domain-containing protein n=1 Tax=Variovorax sp. DAIF25 TaxID=3080983 RepID=UPI003D6C1DD2
MNQTADATAASSADWFPVEFSRNLLPGQVLQSTLLGHELALWRSASGAMEVWENRCPHRSVRLSLGFVVGETLVCRYHGWRYGRDGHCVSVPSSPKNASPPAACARTYLSRESDGIVWASLARMPAGYPPRLGDDLVPSRSFTVDLDADTFALQAERAGWLQGQSTCVWQEGASALLIQPLMPGTSIVHLLVARSASSLDKQRAIESIKTHIARWTAEARAPRETEHA